MEAMKIAAGQIYTSALGATYSDIKILAVVDGFIMIRKGDGFPFVTEPEDFNETYLTHCHYKLSYEPKKRAHTEPGDFQYKRFLCWYYDMPNFKGYEIFENEDVEEMIGRCHTRAECRKAINAYLKNKNK